jgi:GT2 family glycosyltransferase
LWLSTTGSIDNSVAIVSAIADPRIRLFVNEKNIGGAGQL